MRRDRSVKSTSLVDIRSQAHEIQKLSPSDADIIYKFNGIYKVKTSKGQSHHAIFRKFLHYNSEWRANDINIYHAKETQRKEIFDGLFAEGEEVSSRAKKKAQKFVSKINSILENNSDLELCYYASSREDVFYTDGWLIYNSETRELLAVDVSIDYEL